MLSHSVPWQRRTEIRSGFLRKQTGGSTRRCVYPWRMIWVGAARQPRCSRSAFFSSTMMMGRVLMRKRNLNDSRVSHSPLSLSLSLSLCVCGSIAVDLSLSLSLSASLNSLSSAQKYRTQNRSRAFPPCCASVQCQTHTRRPERIPSSSAGPIRPSLTPCRAGQHRQEGASRAGGRAKERAEH